MLGLVLYVDFIVRRRSILDSQKTAGIANSTRSTETRYRTMLAIVSLGTGVVSVALGIPTRWASSLVSHAPEAVLYR
jgi:hypothetical protein